MVRSLGVSFVRDCFEPDVISVSRKRIEDESADVIKPYHLIMLDGVVVVLFCEEIRSSGSNGSKKISDQ